MQYILMFFIGINLYANSLLNLDSFESQFSQTILNSSNKAINYTGVVYIKKPGMILWKYDEPKKDVFINKNKVTIIEPDLEQAIITELQNEINLLNLISNASQIDSHTLQTTINSIDYILKIQNQKLSSISYTDELDNRISIIFSNPKQNQPILISFTPVISENFDIIRK